MVALDQRESLRTMLAAARPGDVPVTDTALTAFKVDAARALTPFASAVLLDVDYGLGPVRRAGAIAPGCGLIVAADRLVQAANGPVEWTEVDDDVFADDQIAAVADAYKLLVIWRAGEEAERRRVVQAFVEACRRRDRPAIVEGIVRSRGGAPLACDDHVELGSEELEACLAAGLPVTVVPGLSSAIAVPMCSNTRNGRNDESDCLKLQCRRLGKSTACPSDETGNSSVAPWSRPMNSACKSVTWIYS